MVVSCSRPTEHRTLKDTGQKFSMFYCFKANCKSLPQHKSKLVQPILALFLYNFKLHHEAFTANNVGNP